MTGILQLQHQNKMYTALEHTKNTIIYIINSKTEYKC